MKPALQLRVQAQLALTPQLQQAIKLLQLSSIELEAELNLALESNPLLDIDESEPEDEIEEFVPSEHTASASVESSDSNSAEPVDSVALVSTTAARRPNSLSRSIGATSTGSTPSAM